MQALDIIKQIKELVDFEKLKYDSKELTQKTQDPMFYSKSNYKDTLSRLDKIEEILSVYNRINDYITLLRIAEELNEKEEEQKILVNIEKHKDKLLKLLKENATKNIYKGCYLKIVAGAGGTESCDFASMIFRMYTLYLNKKEWEYSIINLDDEHCAAGLKTVTILIKSELAYDKLKYECGVHRLVRPSPYNALNKRMTSFVSVFIYPQIEEKKIDEVVTIDESKLSFDYFRCSGAGGQNVNKVNSGVRARYIYIDPETNNQELILVENTETRDQPKNKENALNNLKSILYTKYKLVQQKEKEEQESNKKSIEWSSQIRSYVLDDGRIKDHRTNFISNSPEKILNGDIEEMLLHEINFFEVREKCKHICS